MACGAVDDGGVVRVLAVMNQDGPDVDKDEEGDGCNLGQRKEEGEQVVRQTLGITVQWVESVRCKGGRHDPLVVRLVDVLVNARVVQATVDPVDERVGEEQEERNLSPVIPPSRTLFGCIVQLGVAADFSQEPGDSKDCHYWKGDIGLLHLEGDLVLEVSRMFEGCLVEDEKVG